MSLMITLTAASFRIIKIKNAALDDKFSAYLLSTAYVVRCSPEPEHTNLLVPALHKYTN